MPVTLKSGRVRERPSGEEVGFTMKFLGVWMDETLSLRFEILLPAALSNFILSGVGFEPTPPFGDQNARSHCILGRYLTLSLAP